MSQGEIAIRNGKILDAQKNIIQGYNLTKKVNREIKENTT
jgi:hypothetical protein